MSFSSISRSPTYPSLRRLTSERTDMSDFTTRDPLTRLTPECMDEEMMLPNSNSCYYPDNLLQELIREDVVSQILKRSNIKTNQIELTRFVCTKAKRVFAILISCEQVELIVQVFQCKFTDEMLPVGPGIRSGSSEMESFSAAFADLTIIKPTFDRKVWSYGKLREFYRDRQWPFISPIFSDKPFRRDFHEQCPMPFIEINAEVSKDSNFSLVEKRRVHRDHLRIGRTIVRLM